MVYIKEIGDAYKPYTDKWGMVSPWPDGESSGNGLLYTAQMIAAHVNHELGHMLDEDKIKGIYKQCEVLPGLYMRRPDHGSQEGPDDYVGIGYASAAIDKNIARRVLEYGQIKSNFDPALAPGWKAKALFNVLKLFGMNKYCYNNQAPTFFTFSSWLGRNLSLMAHLHIAAGISIGIVYKIAWAVAVVTSTWSKHHDSLILSWLLIKTYLTMKDRSWILDLATAFFVSKLKKRYPEGIGQLLGDYFVNHQHPNAIYLKGFLV